MDIDLIADLIKGLRSSDVSHRSLRDQLVIILESMRIKIQEHEALLLYAHKTLDLDYHRRADELFKEYKDAVEEDTEKGFLSHDERLARVKRFAREHREARAKLREEFNIES